VDTTYKCRSRGFGSTGLIRSEVPGQQFGDAADWVFGDLGQGRVQTELRIESVEFGRADQRIDRGGALPSRIGAGKQVILAAQGESRKSPPHIGHARDNPDLRARTQLDHGRRISKFMRNRRVSAPLSAGIMASPGNSI
jgi:hypothetical protein